MSLNRTMSAVLAVFVAAIAGAQTIDEGYANLRNNASDVLFVITGTDGRNGGLRFRTELTYHDGTKQQAEILEFMGPITTIDAKLPLVRRLVGDGTAMWSYHYGRREYSSLRYGTYRGAESGSYRDDFFHALSAASRGQSTDATRLLAEIYQGNPAYRTWLAGNSPMIALDDKTLPPRPNVWPPTAITSGYEDPLLASRLYTPTDFYHYQFIYEPTIAHSFAFGMAYDSTLNQWLLQDLFSTQWAGKQVVQWQLTAYRMPTIAPGTFSFVPPSNARAITIRTGG